MSNKNDVRRHYQQLSPSEKARLAFNCLDDNTSIPADLLSGMSGKEQAAYYRSLSILGMAQSRADSELGLIESGCREAALIMTILHRIQSDLLALVDLDALVIGTQEYTESEYARLVEEAAQVWIPLDELVEMEVLDELDKEGPCVCKSAPTKSEHEHRLNKKREELLTLIGSAVLDGKLVDGKHLVRLTSWYQLTDDTRVPEIDPMVEARLFPDEMATIVEEMRQDRALLRERIGLALTSVVSSGDREVRASPQEFAGGSCCAYHPEGDNPAMNHRFPRDALPRNILTWRERMATLQALFERIGDEDFGGANVMGARLAERFRLARLMVSELAQQLGVEEVAVAPDEKAVEETWRRLTDRPQMET